MSEDFDREAERERLREKYERDKQKREATEQMSELLLQGATMTNGHCSECGDPIFRYDGQEFCPTCEKPIDAEEEGESADESADGEEGIEVRSPSDDARVAFGSDSAAEHAGTEPDQPEETDRDDGAAVREPEPEPERSQQPSAPEPPRESGSPERPGSASVERAEQSLVRTLTRFSEQAEATDDPRKATDHLAAAREAAETLAALRR